MRKFGTILTGILAAACILAGCGAAQKTPAETESMVSMQETEAGKATVRELLLKSVTLNQVAIDLLKLNKMQLNLLLNYLKKEVGE